MTDHLFIYLLVDLIFGPTEISCLHTLATFTQSLMETYYYYFTFLEYVIMYSYLFIVHQCKITRELVGWGKATLTCAKTSTHIRLPAEGGNPPQSNPLHPFPEDAQLPSLFFFLPRPYYYSVYIFYVVPSSLFPSFSLLQKHGPSILKQTFRLWKHSALHPSPPTQPRSIPLRQAQQLRKKKRAAGQRPTHTYNEPHGLPSLRTSRPPLYQAKAQSIRRRTSPTAHTSNQGAENERESSTDQLLGSSVSRNPPSDLTRRRPTIPTIPHFRL